MPRLPRKVSRQVKTLLAGDFLDRAENVLVFGRSGTGKTHLLCGLGQELIRQGRRVEMNVGSYRLAEAKDRTETEKSVEKPRAAKPKKPST